ncbi:MAG: hypothetical protein IKU57_03955 [Oscillospiraceae bacterium]|nr:hypothetical protein [Oscillospiraceae bacterium]
MKKILMITLALCMVLSMVACGGSETPAGNEGNSGNAASTPAADSYTFTYKGVELKLYAEAEPILTALGEPTKYTETASCAFDGLDKTYYYGNLYVQTYPENGKDYIYGWWFADDTLTTAENIYIGSTQAEVEAAYGADTFNGTSAYTIKKGEGSLSIIMKDGIVQEIQYAIILK